MNMSIESVLLIPIREAEALVASFRIQFDPSAALGVPAHVTVLYPFKSPGELTRDVVQSLSDLFSQLPGFRASFTESRRFPGVLYLSPEPAPPFRYLTEIVAGRFLETPPYGGQFAEIIPHLTVAQVSEPQRLDEIAVAFERAAQGRLPIQAKVKEVVLMDNERGHWQIRHRFALAPGVA
jgi:2'-5' RNA ligase